MAGEVEWRLVEDSSPENRELGEVVRRLEGIYDGDPSLDWKESRRRRAEALTVLLTASDKNRSLAGRLEGAEYEIGGDEHFVLRVDDQPDRVFKLTHGDCFGCYSFVNISDDAFLNFETRILLTDAAPRNVRIVDGTPALFDAIASFAPDKICEWASLRSNTPPTIADAGVSTRTNQSGFDDALVTPRPPSC